MSVAELSLAFVEENLKAGKVNGQGKSPLFVFISGPQGSGKSYNSDILFRSLNEKGVKVALTSIDDFYLTHKDQLKLQSSFPENGLLKGRGLPGTHDLAVLKETLKRLTDGKANASDAETIQFPVYDKSRFNGEGDRVGNIEAQLPLECVIIEGWFLGFEAVSDVSLQEAYGSAPRGSALLRHELAHLRQVNEWLIEYAAVLWDNKSLDSIGIKFATDDTNNVYKWRLQQERALVASQGQGMGDAQVKSFVDRYMPCYELYYKQFIDPNTRFGERTLTVEIDADRAVTGHFISNS
ncbi:unnamed protein product [Kluyveromyces dobzhanskii CBS 2104]|uniref:WGS project CCBQ000000000 data, contig 00046 n=1 Tax=Kluyveromyces dobzhanskii CBS 2104 TaxID=1427455 RepID=A0A0A8L7H0_9SACH|nr:unnamed protein product [Kluyveromyces dobzhanskii CBS 2104]